MNESNWLSEDIRTLGNLLGETIVEQAGKSVFDLEEEIRAHAKAWRNGDAAASSLIQKSVSEMTTDLGLTADIIKAFSTYFSLVNLAEEHQRINILRRRTETAFRDDHPMDESIGEAIRSLKEQGHSAEDVDAMLKRISIMPVFTAHPTESKRRTTRQILSYVSRQLFDLRSAATPDHQRAGLEENLRGAITLLWQSDDSRKRKPTVLDEVRNTGLYFFEHTLFDEVPRIYKELENSLEKYYPNHEWDVSAILRFGSWIGGDRDGNPFVTNDTTESAIREQKELVLGRYASDVLALYRLLSPSLTRASFDEEFLAQLDEELRTIPMDETEMLGRFVQEPYRQKLILVYRRIMAARRQNQQRWDQLRPNDRAYQSADELNSDLQQIRKSLCNNKSERLADGQLAQLIRRVEVFGFHLASLDIRQHSGNHDSAIAEIFEKRGIEPNYLQLTEDQRRAVLTAEIEKPRPVGIKGDLSEETVELVSLFQLIATAHRVAGTSSIQNYVVSMTESDSDLLEVLWFLSHEGLLGAMDIVPLFETVEDLNAAAEIMTKLFENPAYQRHLQLRGGQQQIMIGYSDSNKDGGFLRANWMLFLAQRNLAETCLQRGVQLTFFHGRGGSIGRGGGPANRSILSQPPESIRGRIRITEQGEVVSSRYTHNEIAYRHLQQLLNAVIRSLGQRPVNANEAKWAETMDELSSVAFKKYRSLVDRPEFIDYFHAATPIDQIAEWNLGSRPSRRKAGQNVADLRAIPWVFAWTQSRTNIPSWYGVGTAFESWIEQGEGALRSQRLEELKTLYRDWPFFKSVLDNVHLGMGRGDMDIASLYSGLCSDSNERNLFSVIESEFELTRKTLLAVTGHDQLLDTEPWLQHSIRMRNPYVDPMNFIQVELLRRLRQTNDESEKTRIRDVILLSINGIAGGLQNVG